MADPEPETTTPPRRAQVWQERVGVFEAGEDDEDAHDGVVRGKAMPPRFPIELDADDGQTASTVRAVLGAQIDAEFLEELGPEPVGMFFPDSPETEDDGTGGSPRRAGNDPFVNDLARLRQDEKAGEDEAAASLASSSADSESDLSRLIEEINAKLEGQESLRRISAISHLKAAVAATVADRKLKADEGDHSGPDRSDGP